MDHVVLNHYLKIEAPKDGVSVISDMKDHYILGEIPTVQQIIDSNMTQEEYMKRITYAIDACHNHGRVVGERSGFEQKTNQVKRALNELFLLED